MSTRHMKKDKKIIPATREESIELDLTDERNVARYYKEIDGVFDGSLYIRKRVLLGKPPEILQKFGIVKPLYCGQSVVRKIVYPEKYGKGKHNLGISLMKELIYELEDPLAITKNRDNHKKDNSIVVWTKWKTKNNKSIITIIKIEKTGKVTLNNYIATTFVSNEKYLRQMIDDEGSILYTKNNKSINQLLHVRRLMPKSHTDDTLINYKISRKNNKVNKI